MLNSLEKSKKQYELYAFLLDEQHRIVLLKDIEAMGYSKSSVDTLIRKGFVENMMLSLNVIHLRLGSLNKM